MVWTSSVYAHYNITIRHNYDEDGAPTDMDYIFTCKTHPENHSGPKTYPCKHADLGTTGLKNDIECCEAAQSIHKLKVSSLPSIQYSPENHRALIALRCAKNARPINTILDDDYRQEVQMLRPGTQIPHPTTVQCDLLHLYKDLSVHVKNHFMVFFLQLTCFKY